MEYWWVRKLLKNGQYYYLYVRKEAAQIYSKTGFEINIDRLEVPIEIREKEESKYD